MTDERFSELRETIRVRDMPLKDAPFDAVVREWEGGMYLDAAEGLSGADLKQPVRRGEVRSTRRTPVEGEKP